MIVEPAGVTLEIATACDETLLSNLLQLYAYDLSDVFGLEPGPEGRFCYAQLPLYWSEPQRRFAFLIRRGRQNIGFALATRGSPVTTDPDDLDVAEFFVLRRYRRSGVGRRAAFLLWDRLIGNWVVRVSDGNRGGVDFWARVIAEYTGGILSCSDIPGDPHPWRVYRFTAAPTETNKRRNRSIADPEN